MRGKNKIFWGIVCLLGAVAILAQRLGFLEGIGFWPVFFSICLTACLIRGIARGRIGTILFSIAFLIIVNDELLHLEAITPWPVLLAALLGTIGLKILFPNLSRLGKGHLIRIGDRGKGITDIQRVEDTVSYDNVFGDSIKYLGGVISFVNVDNVFGSTSIYFTEARLRDGSAEVNVDLLFGNVELYVPSSWSVTIHTSNMFGNAEEAGKCVPDGENTMRVTGDVIFGSLEVIHV